jgi:hypothetical protein
MMEKKLNIKSTVTPTEQIGFNQWCMQFNVSAMTPITTEPTFVNNTNMDKLKKRLKKWGFTFC